MKVSIDVHFGYGVVASFAVAVGILIGLYVNEAISFPLWILFTASYVGFIFAAMWFHQSNLNYRAETLQRAHAADEYRQGVLERAMNPIELEPVDRELSSLRRVG